MLEENLSKLNSGEKKEKTRDEMADELLSEVSSLGKTVPIEYEIDEAVEQLRYYKSRYNQVANTSSENRQAFSLMATDSLYHEALFKLEGLVEQLKKTIEEKKEAKKI